jgi:hypothetical protein
MCSQKATVVSEINRALLAESEAPSYSVENLEKWLANALYRWRSARRGHRPPS